MELAVSKLLQLLRERSFRKGEFTLASGRTSDFFIDCKTTVLRADGHALVGPALLEGIRELGPVEAVAGVALGGCPLASAVAIASVQSPPPIDAIYVRKSVKDHGSRRRVEGASHLAEGAPVAVVEDTVTTGGSTLRAISQLRDAGLSIVGVVAVVDRLEGAREAFDEAQVPFRSLFTRRDFM